MRVVAKLTLALVLGMGLVLAAYGYYALRREAYLYRSEAKRHQRVLGHAIAASVSQAWQRGGAAQAIKVIELANRRDDGVRVRWTWVNEEVPVIDVPQLARDDVATLAAGRDIARVHVMATGEKHLFVYVPIPVDEGKLGALELSESVREQSEHALSAALSAGAAILLAAATSALIAVVLGAVVVGRPVRLLVDKARRIGDGDLEGELTLGKDELGELAGEMNQMAARLRESRERAERETAARIAVLEQLRHADRLSTVGRLAAGIAHELGSPLQVADGRARMIQRGAGLPADQEHARIVVDQLRRMTHIIRQFLDFARAGKPQKRSADLGLVARQAVGLLAPLARKRDVALEVEDRGPVRTAFDPDQIQQVLANLIMNGVQAMPHGGTLTVVIGYEEATPPHEVGAPSGPYAFVAVKDQGTGIPEEHRARVFEPFYTTKDVGEGTGLGLAVSYGIVREHQGFIHLESEVGKGSTFTVYFPMTPAAPAATAQPTV